MSRKTSKQTYPPASISWHRLFGLLLADYLADSPFEVELEKDLSHRKQLLDVVVVRRRAGVMDRPMPDGMNDLTDHNLITFKSFRETLDDWTLKELTGHYVNYRKQQSDQSEALPDEALFSLFAISARFPRELFKVVAAEQVQSGVYDCRRGSDRIRVIVAGELAESEQNSLLHLFSAAQDRVEYGRQHHRLNDNDTSSIVNSVFKLYQKEGLIMPYTIEDFRREVQPYYIAQTLKTLTPEELLSKLTPEQILSKLSPKQLLSKLSTEQIEVYLKKQKRRTAAAKLKKKRKKA